MKALIGPPIGLLNIVLICDYKTKNRIPNENRSLNVFINKLCKMIT